LEGKWGVRAHQTQEMKGKEDSGDPEGQEAKSGLASSGRGLDTSGEKGFFADATNAYELDPASNESIPRAPDSQGNMGKVLQGQENVWDF